MWNITETDFWVWENFDIEMIVAGLKARILDAVYFLSNRKETELQLSKFVWSTLEILVIKVGDELAAKGLAGPPFLGS